MALWLLLNLAYIIVIGQKFSLGDLKNIGTVLENVISYGFEYIPKYSECCN